MEYVLIFNGLGNQMSQYAYYLSKKTFNHDCHYIYYGNFHNGYELEKVFDIKANNTLSSKLLSFLYFRFLCYHKVQNLLKPFFKVFHESRNYDYAPELLHQKLKGINFYRGGWHSEKNFLEIKDQIQKVFTFPEPSEKSEFSEILNTIRKDENSVSIHFRRGDYINIAPTDYYQFGGVATDDYYMKAIDYIREHVANPVFFIFSNDVEWCKSNLNLKHSTIVSCNQVANSWRDLQLMTECRHHIIANSSFSWWGAWLSKHEGITIRPKWFIRDVVTKDFYPEKWIRID
jgi:hypothetical protein